MKSEIHPQYNYVVFHDISCDKKVLTRSTIKTNRTTTLDGKEYPCVPVDISMYSHPFYTGKMKLLDSAGMVEKFSRRFSKTQGKAVERVAQKGKRTLKAPPKIKAKVLSTAPQPGKRDKKVADKKTDKKGK